MMRAPATKYEMTPAISLLNVMHRLDSKLADIHDVDATRVMHIFIDHTFIQEHPLAKIYNNY